MPPPSSEHDLKRLARRRLIGAVALTLAAVIVLPLFLEDEPPPTSSLSVHMAAAPEQAAQPERTAGPAAAAVPTPSAPPAPPQPAPPLDPARPATKPESPPESKPGPESRPEPIKSGPVKPEPARPPKPQAVHPADAPVRETKPAAGSANFVVQLAALSDGGRARELKARAALAGLPAYTDTVGSLTRVRVGPFDTREAAAAAVAKLSENGMTGKVLAK